MVPDGALEAEGFHPGFGGGIGDADVAVGDIEAVIGGFVEEEGAFALVVPVEVAGAVGGGGGKLEVEPAGLEEFAPGVGEGDGGVVEGAGLCEGDGGVGGGGKGDGDGDGVFPDEAGEAVEGVADAGGGELEEGVGGVLHGGGAGFRRGFGGFRGSCGACRRGSGCRRVFGGRGWRGGCWRWRCRGGWRRSRT